MDLLLTDVIMPGCNGKELYRRLCTRLPELKVLYMSGYTDNVISDKGLIKDGIAFISKPFTINDLSHKVLEVLQEN